jgi:hypothetical protein
MINLSSIKQTEKHSKALQPVKIYFQMVRIESQCLLRLFALGASEVLRQARSQMLEIASTAPQGKLSG